MAYIWILGLNGVYIRLSTTKAQLFTKLQPITHFILILKTQHHIFFTVQPIAFVFIPNITSDKTQNLEVKPKSHKQHIKHKKIPPSRRLNLFIILRIKSSCSCYLPLKKRVKRHLVLKFVCARQFHHSIFRNSQYVTGFYKYPSI